MNTQDIKKGFNNGYLLQSHMPKLAEKFAKELAGRDDPYALGFIAGIKERDKERLKTRDKNYTLHTHPPKGKQKNKDKDIRKDLDKER